MNEIIFLKLGGSLITDKHTPLTAKPELIRQIVSEIKYSIGNRRILIGHGSGSFGHVAAKKYQTQRGVNTEAEWVGFAEVWHAARTLNQILVDALHAAELPIVAFPPSSTCITENHQVKQWDLRPIHHALDHNLIPLINGDTVFDCILGGTILSTEDLFAHLAKHLKPNKILLAGIEPGVWEDFPDCTKILSRITPSSFESLQKSIGGSTSTDVTGGMLQKVKIMLEIIHQSPQTRGLIFSGLEPGSISQAILDQSKGTWIEKDP